MKKISKNILWIPVSLWMAGIFFSCSNNLEDIKKITLHPNAPDETSEQFHMIYTDSGLAQVEIFAQIAATNTFPQKITSFKDGLKVNFYDKKGKVESILTSKYGEINEETGIISVRDSVRLLNVNDQRTLETEVLYWNQNGDSIYTNNAVVITTKDMILTGIGAWTTPSFESAEFYQPSAKIFIQE